MSAAITEYKPLTLETMTPDQVQLFKSYICKDATKSELLLFLMYVNNLQLDPFIKDIYFIKYGSAAPTIVVGINGFRKVAARSGQHAGTERGVMRDNDGKLIGAYAKVYRKDWVQPASTEILLEEYNTGQGQWRKMPASMAMKTAEVAALRMAFPELSGVYSEEEMEQAKVKDVGPQGDIIKQELEKAMEKKE